MNQDFKNALFTTKPIVSVIVEILAPRKGKLYDGACGAGGMFVSGKRYALTHGSTARDLSIYGQEASCVFRTNVTGDSGIVTETSRSLSALAGEKKPGRAGLAKPRGARGQGGF